ncbi:MAG: carbohydrate ABC transporter permease [Bacilli bacterium]|nr:carbohydrate ABC transporter permease [Bacilli bacterium]
MPLLIIFSLIIALFVIVIIYKTIEKPSRRDGRLNHNLVIDETIELEYQKQIRREIIAKVVRYVIAYSLLTVAAFLVVFPFYWMFATSVKSAEEVMKMPPTIFPHEIHIENFKVAMQSANFGRFLINTLIVGVFSTLGTLVTTVTSAFAFARLNFRGRDLLFSMFIATMMIPGEMMVITNFITIMEWGMYNTYAAMIIPFWVSTYYIYLLRNTFKQIPNELYYAAKVDGTSDFKYLLKVMLPIASPTIITITILKLMGAWNSYVWPNLITDEDMRLITNGLRGSFSSEDGATVHLQMAATTVVTVPLLLVFIFFRKYIMRGVSRSGIKG